VSAGVAEIAGHFQFEGTLIDATPYGNGHINDTYAVRCRLPDGTMRRYLPQRINRNVFRDPVALMSNVEHVTRHLRAKVIAAGGNPQRETLNLVPTLDGGPYIRDASGEFWRAYVFIEGATAYSCVTSQEQVYSTAKAFGSFQRLLSDFPADALHATIPDFHNTPKRYAAFLEAVELDRAGRAHSVAGEIEFVLRRAADTAVLENLRGQSLLPLRVTHNDTKFNNVMIDDATGEGLCVIDLDTVMPGLALYDFGDAVRSGAARSAEDEPDAAKAGMSLETFESLARGYLDAARDFLTPIEIDHLAFSARAITLEQVIRFLGDYLNGDTYYKIHREHHNLDRARTQIRMLEEMERNFDRMEAIVALYR